MTYIVDGDIGSIQPEPGDAPAGANAQIDSVKTMEDEQIISLVFPTILDFSTITWKIRFPVNFDRAFMDKDMKEQQPDGFIDGWTGYTRYSSGPYFFVDTDNEWFEAHGGIDGAWWQFLFIGLGQALFTDGEFSATIDIEENAFYYVSMLINTTLLSVTLTLTDSAGTVLASNVRENVDTLLIYSTLGASGKVYNLVGDKVDASSNITLVSDITDEQAREPGQQWTREGSSGYETDGNNGVMTHNLGSCAGTRADTWVSRPYWAECEGMLDYTFYNNLTTGGWWHFSSDIDPPDGYPYLIWKPKIAPDNEQSDAWGPHQPCDWPGKTVLGLASSHWPQGWEDGEKSGLHTFIVEGNQWPTFVCSVDNFRSDNHIFFGIEPEAMSWAEMPPWYFCGGGFDWPWRVGWGNSWRAYSWGDDWEFYWAASIDEGEDFQFDTDWISLADSDPGVLPENNDYVPMEGWNTEMVSVVDGYFNIGATPVRGTVNVYTEDGYLMFYGEEWEEAEETDEFGPGRRFKILSGSHRIVVVVYFLTKPVLGNSPIISRPTEEETYQTRPRSTRTPFPM